MLIQSTNYIDIENNPDYIFSDEILYISDVSFIGLAIVERGEDKTPNEYATVYVNIAIRLDDMRSIMKLSYMISVTEKEYRNIKPYQDIFITRGITELVPHMLVISDYFVRDRDEYYIYTINSKDEERNTIFSFSCEFMGMVKINHILNMIKDILVQNTKIKFRDIDTITNIPESKITHINAGFNNEFEFLGVYKPPKKLFESSFSCLVLCKYIHNRKEYYFFMTVIASAGERKSIKDSTYNHIDDFYESTPEDQTYMIISKPNISYYRKKATEITNKVLFVGMRMDKADMICFEFSDNIFDKFIKDIRLYLKK